MSTPRLLDQLRDAIRVRHYRIRTEQAHSHCVRRYIFFHNKRHLADLGAAEIGAFLTNLASHEKVAALTQNRVL